MPFQGISNTMCLEKHACQTQLRWSQCNHFSREFFSRQTLLALDLVTQRVGSLNAWFNSHSGFNGCHIMRFENRILIPFSYHAPKSGVVAKVSFHNGFNGCHILRFQNRTLIPFFYHASKSEVVAKVSFYKTCNFV